MSETVQPTVPETSQDNVVNYSKPKSVEVHTPQGFTPSTKESADKNAASRAARLRAAMEQLGNEEEATEKERLREHYRARDEKTGKFEAKTDPEDDTAGDDEPTSTYSKEDDEKRKAARRAQVEAKTAGKEDKPEDKEESAAKAEGEEPEVKVEEPKKEDEATKLDKERRAKFEKVLAMEAKAQKDAANLRHREARLVERERELSNNLKRAQAQLDAQAKRYENDISMARQILKLAQDNPLELLEQAGAKPEDVTTWVERASDPNAQRIKALEARLEQEARQRAQMEQREAARKEEEARQSQMRQVEDTSLSSFEEKDASGDYTFEAAVTIYPRNELVRLGHEIAGDAYRQGLSFTHRDIAEAVNALAMEDPRYKRLQEKLSKSVAKPETKTEPAKVAASTQPAAPAKPKTTTVMTNSVAQQPSSVSKPKANPNYKREREARNRRLMMGLDE